MRVLRLDASAVLKLLVGLVLVWFCCFRGIEHLLAMQENAQRAAFFAEQEALDADKITLANHIDDLKYDMHRGTLTGVWGIGKNIKVGPFIDGGHRYYWIVSPLTLNDGTIVLVNRGRVSERLVAIMLETRPPVGVVRVVGTLRRSADQAGTSGEAGQTYNEINIDGIAAMRGLKNVAPLALFMERSEPKDDSALGVVLPPTSDGVSHINQAVFWFGLGLLVCVLCWVLVLKPFKKPVDVPFGSVS